MPSDTGKQTFSLWLIPEKPEFQVLKAIISENQHRSNQPVFIPHITLLSGITLSEGLEETVRELCRGSSRLTLHCEKSKIGNNYFHCLFVSIVMSEKLDQLRNRVADLIPVSSLQPFRPHVSLMYHNPDSDLVRETETKLPDFSTWELKISHIELWRTSGPVSDWKSVFRCNLDTGI